MKICYEGDVQNIKRNNTTDFGRKPKAMSERIFVKIVRREAVITESDKRAVMKEKRKTNKRREDGVSE